MTEMRQKMADEFTIFTCKKCGLRIRMIGGKPWEEDAAAYQHWLKAGHFNG